jgi:energy-coupling factor transporter ATP-binding protein EcfA2
VPRSRASFRGGSAASSHATSASCSASARNSGTTYRSPAASTCSGASTGSSAACQRERLARLAATFAIADLLERPVAQLSLGQRLRCEIAAALLHAPAILLLDEPTIGLDLSAKAALRDHLTALSRADGTTILLTSHDTGDIERICERAIIIDHGRLLLDLALERLRGDFLTHRTVVIVSEQERPALSIPGVTTTAAEPHRLTLAVDLSVASVEQTVAAALAQLTVRDLVIGNPPLDDIIRFDLSRRQGEQRCAAGGLRAGALWAFVLLGWRRAIAERAALAGRLALYPLILVIFRQLWLATPLQELGQSSPTAAEMLWYVAITEWVVFAAGTPYRAVEEQIRSGQIESALLRPLPYAAATLAEWSGATGFYLLAMGAGGLATAAALTGTVPLTAATALPLLLAGALGSAIALLFQLQLGYAAAWLGTSAAAVLDLAEADVRLRRPAAAADVLSAGAALSRGVQPVCRHPVRAGLAHPGPAGASVAAILGRQAAWFVVIALATLLVDRAAAARLAQRGA